MGIFLSTYLQSTCAMLGDKEHCILHLTSHIIMKLTGSTQSRVCLQAHNDETRALSVTHSLLCSMMMYGDVLTFGTHN